MVILIFVFWFFNFCINFFIKTHLKILNTSINLRKSETEQKAIYNKTFRQNKKLVWGGRLPKDLEEDNQIDAEEDEGYNDKYDTEEEEEDLGSEDEEWITNKSFFRQLSKTYFKQINCWLILNRTMPYKICVKSKTQAVRALFQI